MLAISYFIDNHQGPCNHSSVINIYKFENIHKTKSFKEKISIDTNVIKNYDKLKIFRVVSSV